MNSTAWSVIGVLVFIGAIALLLSFSNPAAPVDTAALTVAADDHTKGAAAGKVTIIEYLDFECPSCGAYYPIVKQLEAEFGANVTFVTRFFPLPGHRNGLSSALAAEAAGRQGKFNEMADLLFTRQNDWDQSQRVTPEVFEGYATELGLDIEQFKADVASEEVQARVDRDRKAGMALGINGTPTFFVNGTKIQNPQSIDAFRALIQAELAK